MFAAIALQLRGVAQSFGGEGSDVIVNRDIWPVSGEDTAAIGVDFAERDRFETSSFEAKRKSPYA
jgi:hypothetical protein